MRSVLLALALVLSVACTASSPLSAVAARLGGPSPGDEALARTAESLVATFEGSSGIYIADPARSAPVVSLNADTPMEMASLYKLGVMLHAERLVDAGSLTYRDTITIERADVLPSGAFEAPGTVMTIDEALEAMVTYSDNGPALALVRRFGAAAINASIVSEQLGEFHLAITDDEDNLATARAVGTLFTRLATKQLVSQKASERMLARLERQHVNDRLPRELPDSAVVAHKTGNLIGVVHDAGIVFTRLGPRVVVALTANGREDEANELIADLGALVYEGPEQPAVAVGDPPAQQIASPARSLLSGSDWFILAGALAIIAQWRLRSRANRARHPRTTQAVRRVRR